MTSALAPYIGSGMVVASGVLIILSYFGRAFGLTRAERRVSSGLAVAAMITAGVWMVP